MIYLTIPDILPSPDLQFYIHKKQTSIFAAL